MLRAIWICALGLVVAVAAETRAEDWPEFRGPTGQGHAENADLPLHWSATENIAWKQTIPGNGWSSPILWRGRIYLTTAVPLPAAAEDQSEQSLRALCLDAESGETLWDREVFRQVANTNGAIHKKNSHASPTPLADGKRVFVHFGTHGTACLDLEGNVLWRNQELKYQPVHGNGGSPVLVDDRLIVSCDGGDVQFVIALDASTGETRWKVPRVTDAPKKFAFSTPLAVEAAGKSQVISPGADAVNSYDPATGREIWRVTYDGYSVIPRPVFGQGLVFICTGYDHPKLLAIRPDGEGDVTATHVVWTLQKRVPNSPSLTLVGSELYLISDDGVATCVDALSGRQHWQKRIGGNYSASPIDAAGRIYFQSEQGEGVVIEASREFRELARNSLGERTLASYAVGEQCLFIRSDKHLFRIQGR